MCRLLAVSSSKPFEINPFIDNLRQIAINSNVYQGDGWGVSYLSNDHWRLIKNINPIWENDWEVSIQTTMMLAHVRSAFQEDTIQLDNNMPFLNSNLAFIFNGELHRVKINESGNTGAEKIFRLIQKFLTSGIEYSIDKTLKILRLKSEYVIASNIIMSDGTKFYCLNYFNENPDYFTMYKSISEDFTIVSSEMFGDYNWKKLKLATIEVL